MDGSESVGADFEHLHARLHGAGEPLQYTLQGRLAESSRTKIWAVLEPHKDAVRRRRDVKKSLRQALEKGGDSGIGQWINHTCCNHHCNAEFQLTSAISGDPRQGDTDEEGAIKLVVRASKTINRHETVLVHYNPNSGIQSWGKVFKCTCCLCRGICGPTALLGDNTEQSFARLIQQAYHIGIRSNVEISQGDFVSTHQRDRGTSRNHTQEVLKCECSVQKIGNLSSEKFRQQSLNKRNRRSGGREQRRSSPSRRSPKSGHTQIAPLGAEGGWRTRR